MDVIEATADVGALCARAAEMMDAGRAGAARPLLAAARSLAPPSARLSLLSARLALSDGAPDAALRELSAALAVTPDNAELWKSRGALRRQMGDTEGAARDAAEAVVLDAGDPGAKAILGAALLDLGRPGDAVICLRAAVTAMPDDIVCRETLAAALEAAGDAEAGLAVLTAGIAACPTSVALRNAAVLACVRRRDFTRACVLAEKARAAGIADACTFGMKGHALSSLGQHEEAADAYREAFKLGPNDPYVRHLVAASGVLPGATRAPDDYIRTVFDGYAGSFEAHLISLGYSIPGAIRTALLSHPKIAAGVPIGPVLDLGCGTGLAVLAISDLAAGPFTGVDLSGRMLNQARAKQLYADLVQADIMDALAADTRHWPVILAADVMCYFGALEMPLSLVHARLEPGGWFIFSVEELQADFDGIIPGNGSWSLHRHGRYAHASDYVHEAAIAAGFRVLRLERPVIRHEAGAAVPGLLLTLERRRHDG